MPVAVVAIGCVFKGANQKGADMANSVTITDVGAIQALTIDVPDDGGVVVLRGRNGSGKSTAIEAIEGTLRGRAALSPRDHMPRGVVDAFGATLKVAKRVTSSGQLEVDVLDSEASPATLVDPGIKDPEKADAARIRALLQLLQIEPDTQPFRDAFGDGMDFDAIVDAEDVEDVGDVVQLAAVIKRACQKKAREAETQADISGGKAAGVGELDADLLAAAAAVGIAPDKPLPSAESLQGAVNAAVLFQGKLDNQKVLSDRVQQSADEARAALVKLQAGEDLEAYRAEAVEAVNALDMVAKSLDDCLASIKDIETRLPLLKMQQQALESEKASLQKRADKAANELTAAEGREANREDTMATLQAQIDRAAQQPAPTDADVEEAALAVALTAKALEIRNRLASHQERAAKAAEHNAAAIEAARKAKRLRTLADATDSILSGLVAKAGAPVKVLAGRLYVDTKRGETPLAELSHGERWALAMDIVLQSVPDGDGLLVLTMPQEAWEGLDHGNQRAVAEAAAARRVVIFTGECSDDPTVRAETYVPV